jgi:hypothetical protein
LRSHPLTEPLAEQRPTTLRRIRRRAALSAAAAGLSPFISVPGIVTAASPAPILFTSFESAAAFNSGTHDGTVTTGESVSLAPGMTEGTWTSPVVQPGFPFSRLVPSWNASTPGASHVRIDVRVYPAPPAGAAPQPSPWYAIGAWAEEDAAIARASVRGQADAAARVDTDTVAARAAPFTAYELRFTLVRTAPEEPDPSLRLAAAAVSNATGAGASSAAASLPHAQPAVALPVPQYSQEIHAHHYPQWAGGGEAWCSPASTQMVVEFWGHRPSGEHLSWIPAGHPDPVVDYAARATYDANYRGTGNWPFNTAYAARYGLRAFVTQLRSLAEAELFLRAGIPLIASIRAAPRELAGFPLPQGTNGHLLVLCGIDGAGSVIVNDPAAPANASVRRTYDRGQIERAWLRGSGGTVYVIHPPDAPLPQHVPDATPNW